RLSASESHDVASPMTSMTKVRDRLAAMVDETENWNGIQKEKLDAFVNGTWQQDDGKVDASARADGNATVISKFDKSKLEPALAQLFPGRDYADALRGVAEVLGAPGDATVEILNVEDPFNVEYGARGVQVGMQVPYYGI